MAKLRTLARTNSVRGWACAILVAAIYSTSMGTTDTTVRAESQGERHVNSDEPKKTESKIGEPQNGLKLARTLCATCHLIGEPPNSATAADVPSFLSIADRPNQSTERLSNWLIEPHAPMPNLHLTRTEILDLGAYILTLRTAK